MQHAEVINRVAAEKPNPVHPAELAGLDMGSSTTNGIVAAMYASKTMGLNLGLQEMVLELNRQVRDAQQGDRKQAEEMLHFQAATLNATFSCS